MRSFITTLLAVGTVTAGVLPRQGWTAGQFGQANGDVSNHNDSNAPPPWFRGPKDAPTFANPIPVLSHPTKIGSNPMATGPAGHPTPGQTGGYPLGILPPGISVRPHVSGSTPAARPTARPTSQDLPKPSAPPSKDTPDQGQNGDGQQAMADVLSIANKWRAKLGHPLFTYSNKMYNNALKTAYNGRGQMVHELNSGTYGQVLAPGDNASTEEFERVFVGGWLCERPELPGLDGICDELSKGWVYNGQVGHANALINNDYTCIGCAYVFGIWACDMSIDSC